MATRTTYTSTINVPVYGSWKCEHCGEVNFSAGVIGCKSQESTTSFRKSKHEEAKSKAASLSEIEWAENAYKIISHPNNNAQSMRNDLFMQNTCCTKCGKKPKWDKDMKYLTWGGLCFMPAIISGFAAFGMGTSVVAWLIFIALLAIIVIAFISEPRYKKMMAKLPKEYTPILGSLNADLIEYAEHIGKTIPTPDDTIKTVKDFGSSINLSQEKIQLAVEESISGKCTASADGDKKAPCSFCRKCGAQLQTGSGFCNKCGTKVKE